MAKTMKILAWTALGSGAAAYLLFLFFMGCAQGILPDYTREVKFIFPVEYGVLYGVYLVMFIWLVFVICRNTAASTSVCAEIWIVAALSGILGIFCDMGLAFHTSRIGYVRAYQMVHEVSTMIAGYLFEISRALGIAACGMSIAYKKIQVKEKRL